MHKGEGHRQRLREKFLESGLSGFADYEVIELLLTLATPRRDCKQPAKDALKKFKTLQSVIEAAPAELCEIKGIGEKNLFGIKLIKETCKRYLKKRAIGKKYAENPKELLEYLCYDMSEKDREIFKVVYLDANNRVLDIEKLFEGSLTESAVIPREIVKAALSHKAAAVIFVHNHPSGIPLPSEQDIIITKELMLACHVVSIEVYDHIIIGKNKYYSFSENGHIAEIKHEFKNRK
jgi:DNA repair protein RadC